MHKIFTLSRKTSVSFEKKCLFYRVLISLKDEFVVVVPQHVGGILCRCSSYSVYVGIYFIFYYLFILSKSTLL